MSDASMEPANLVPKLNPVQKYALLYAEAKARQPVRGKLWYQKGLFLLAQKSPDLANELAYEPSLMGPLSDSLDWNLDQLESVGMLVRTDSKYLTTRFGDECARLLRKEFDSSELAHMEEIKDLLNDLPRDELLALVYALYPLMTVESQELARILPKRKDLAVSLYGRGKVGLELGARIANLSVQEFASLLSERGLRKYAE